MKVSRAQMAENRRQILDVAGRLFRQKGFDGVSVAEVMKAAGFTHGGFYGHFASKEDLFVQALGHAIDARRDGEADFGSFLDGYLSPSHRDAAADGCPIAGLAAESLRQPPEARETLGDGVRAQIDWMSARMAGESDEDRRRRAIAAWAAMVGALILSRATADDALSGEILDATRAWIGDGVDRPADSAPLAEASNGPGVSPEGDADLGRRQ